MNNLNENLTVIPKQHIYPIIIPILYFKDINGQHNSFFEMKLFKNSSFGFIKPRFVSLNSFDGIYLSAI